MGGSKAPTVLHFLSFLFHHRSMTTVTKQVQHGPHWTESLFMTGGNGEELDCTNLFDTLELPNLVMF